MSQCVVEEDGLVCSFLSHFRSKFCAGWVGYGEQTSTTVKGYHVNATPYYRRCRSFTQHIYGAKLGL